MQLFPLDMAALPELAVDHAAFDFYRDAMAALAEGGVEFLVGGAYAFERYTGIARHTKDFDVFVRRGDLDRGLQVLEARGYRTELEFPHWLGKAHHGSNFVDLIFGAGNGVAVVDDHWFRRAVTGEALGMPVRLCPAEEMIWSKAFIMERERFDGADVLHLIEAAGETLDWDHLLTRFAPHPRVLLSHLILFGFVYPDRRNVIPATIMRRLLSDLDGELDTAAAGEKVCNGTLLSRAQYLTDIGRRGYRDARLEPGGSMRAEDVAFWTSKIEGEKK